MDKKTTLTEKQLNELASLRLERLSLTEAINKRTLELKEYFNKNSGNLDEEYVTSMDLLLGSMKQYLFFLNGHISTKQTEYGMPNEVIKIKDKIITN